MCEKIHDTFLFGTAGNLQTDSGFNITKIDLRLEIETVSVRKLLR